MTKVNNKNIISFKNVTKKFGDFTVLNNISLDIEENKIFGIVGKSGAGKSTFIRTINGLEEPTSGRIIVDGKEINSLSNTDLRILRYEIGMIFQNFNLFSSKTILKNVLYPLNIAGVNKKKAVDRAKELLDFVGLSSHIKKYPSQISGGQKQRVAIARALANKPKLLLSDESTASLDPETTDKILKLLEKVNSEFGITIVAVTHEMDVVRKICSSVAIMEHGEFIEVGDTYSVFSKSDNKVTKKYINNALNYIPGKKTLKHLRKKYFGRFVSVPVIDGYKGKSFFEYLSAHNVKGNMIYGSVVEVGNKPLGSMLFNLVGSEKNIITMMNDILKSSNLIDFGHSFELNYIKKGEKIKNG